MGAKLLSGTHCAVYMLSQLYVFLVVGLTNGTLFFVSRMCVLVGFNMGQLKIIWQQNVCLCWS